MKHYFGMDLPEEHERDENGDIDIDTIGYSMANTYARDALDDVVNYFTDILDLARKDPSYDVDTSKLAGAVKHLITASNLIDEMWDN